MSIKLGERVREMVEAGHPQKQAVAAAYREARGADAIEEEVTPEMVEAGINEWSLFGKGDRIDWMVSEIYTAMRRASRGIRSAAPAIPTEESCRKALSVLLSSRNDLESRIKK